MRHLAVGALACSVEPALANGPRRQQFGAEKLSPVLVQLLAVVLVLENRPSPPCFSGASTAWPSNARALKTPIMFVVGLLIVMVAQYNPMDQILSAVAGAAPATARAAPR